MIMTFIVSLFVYSEEETRSMVKGGDHDDGEEDLDAEFSVCCLYFSLLSFI